MRSYRVALLGDSLVGKSSWVNRLQRGECTRDPISEEPLEMATTRGPVSFSIREFCSLSTFDGGGKVIPVVTVGEFDAVIIMGDSTHQPSLDNMTRRCLPDVCKYLPGLPVFFVTNKASPEDTYTNMGCFPYFFVGAATGHKVEEPLIAIARHLTGSQDLEFVAKPPVVAPLVRLEIRQDVAVRLLELLNGLVSAQ